MSKVIYHTENVTNKTLAAGGGKAHNHGNTGTATPGTNSQLSSTESIINPYITVYMWKRIS